MDFIIITLLFAVIALLLTQQNRLPNAVLRKRSIILDSCALIDGRIVEITKSGFITDTLIIPKFILTELQYLADGNDSHKRERARFGLDVAKELEEALPSQVRINQTMFPSLNTTDDKLVVLAKKLKADLYTTDFNLNKVASVEGVRVLNVNELAQQLRPSALPGEEKTVKIMQKGSSQNQGVGYLEDGTMIVVENGASHVGKQVTVTIAQMHQTVAGKMVFAKLRQPVQGNNEPRRQRGRGGSAVQATPTQLPQKRHSSSLSSRLRRP